MENRDDLIEVVKRLKVHTGPYLSQICGVDAAGPQFVGTGNIVRFGSNNFVLTAAHVLDQVDADYGPQCAFTIGDDNEVVPLNATVAQWPIPKDLAAAVIDVDGHEESILQESCFAPNSDNVDDSDLYVVHGFPGSQTISTTFGGGHVIARTLPFGCYFLPKSSWSQFDPKLHIAVSYSADNNTDEQGHTVATPMAQGMSGSLLWKSNAVGRLSEWSPADARVVGLVHHWSQSGQCLVATRIEYVRGLLKYINQQSSDAP